MGFRPEELAGARPWRLAAFTTYALSLSFFESVVLDRLVRGRTEEALVLADAEGIRAALSEQGAQRAGREYEVEPVFLGNGAFHAKVCLFDGGQDDVHLVVSSGNLTFGGWGRNLELAEHLHPSFAGAAFSDASAFFEGLASLAGAHGARERCLDMAERLARAAELGGGDGSVRLLHGFGESIGERIAATCEELGGASRLTAAAPFWDGGQAAARLCRSLGLDSIHVHAHPAGTVQGDAGDCWPRSASVEVVPVLASPFAADPRVLHAKAFEIVCRKGRVLVSGSANGTFAALYGGNVEACVARVMRGDSAAWTLEPAHPLPPSARAAAGDGEVAEAPGILRAQVSGDVVSGRVLTPRIPGEARLSRVTAEGADPLCDVAIGKDGSFSATVPGIEAAALRGGRLVLRIEADGRFAEGFASLSAVTGLRRIAGKAAPSLFSILSGNETPEDVRVLMEWAYENAAALAAARPSGSGSGRKEGWEPSGTKLAQADLWNAAVPAGGRAAAPGRQAGWTRFVDSLISSLRARRGLIGRDEDEDVKESGRRTGGKGSGAKGGAGQAAANAVDKALAAMLPKGASGHAGIRALDLAAYACDRLGDAVTPAQAEEWLRKGVGAVLNGGVPEDRLPDAWAACLVLFGFSGDEDAARSARGSLLRAGADLERPAPDGSWVKPFLDRMEKAGSLDEAWEAARRIRTWREEARLYVEALAAGVPSGGYEGFLRQAGQDAGALEQAFAGGQARRRVKVLSAWSSACCNIQLPKLELSRLRQYGVARAANCCQKVLVWPEGADG